MPNQSKLIFRKRKSNTPFIQISCECFHFRHHSYTQGWLQRRSQTLCDSGNSRVIQFLKDCFEKGNESFISKTEAKILPILVTVVKDTGDENSIMKYGGSYTKKTELEKFKSFVTSFFTMSRECIEKWADWIPDPQRGFVKAQKAVQSCSPNPRDKGFVYFRPEQ